MLEIALSRGVRPRLDPYEFTFAQAAVDISEFDELFQRFIDARMSFDTPEVLTSSDLDYYERLFKIFGLNFYAIDYYSIDQEAENVFPFFKYARAWSKVTDTGRDDHPSFWRFKVQVFLRDEDKANRSLIVHELSHVFGDIVAEGLSFTNCVVQRGAVNLNPVLYEKTPFEISLWNNLFREGLAILFESTDTLHLNDDLMQEAKVLDYLSMTVFDFLTIVRPEDKRQPHSSTYVLLTKNIAAGLVSEQISRFGQQVITPTADSLSYWHLPEILESQQDEQIAMFAEMVQLPVLTFLEKYHRDYLARKKIVVEPLLAWVEVGR